MKEKIKVGYVGLGERGYAMLERCVAKMKDVEVAYVCDVQSEFVEKAKNMIRDNCGFTPIGTADYRDILADKSVDAVFIMIGWDGRTEMIIEFMNEGKYVGFEVGTAESLSECYDLVNAYEKTGVPAMMLENCCYGRRELLLLNMIKKGLFGEVVHCTGGYQHYCTEVVTFKGVDNENFEKYNFRLKHQLEHNRESYPTHELGPICKMLNINRGNRLVRLNSVASKASALKSYAKEHFGDDCPWAKLDYKQGDIVNTVITCENGETILLTNDSNLPRAYYSRNISVRGTKAMSNEDRKVVFLDSMSKDIDPHSDIGLSNNEQEFYDKYDHPISREMVNACDWDDARRINWLVIRAFVESVKAGINTPIDIYDAATWMSIGVLSEQSIASNGAPVDIPDFTNGKYKNREPIVKGKYCLEEICEDDNIKVM